MQFLNFRSKVQVGWKVHECTLVKLFFLATQNPFPEKACTPWACMHCTASLNSMGITIPFLRAAGCKQYSGLRFVCSRDSDASVPRNASVTKPGPEVQRCSLLESKGWIKGIMIIWYNTRCLKTLFLLKLDYWKWTSKLWCTPFWFHVVQVSQVWK